MYLHVVSYVRVHANAGLRLVGDVLSQSNRAEQVTTLRLEHNVTQEELKTTMLRIRSAKLRQILLACSPQKSAQIFEIVR